MTSTHSRDSKQQLLANNYWYLFDLYRRGRFETPVDPSIFEFYQPDPAEKINKDKPFGTLKPAADDLYVLACDLAEDVIANAGQFTSESRDEIIELVLRSKVLSYEIDDYFLSIPVPKSRQFIDLSKEVSYSLPDYFEKHYGFVSDLNKRKIVQYLLLSALCGINELYRKHNKTDYEEGVKRGEEILKYIKDELPRLPSPTGSGKGVSGLCYYILGRLHFALGNYHTADCYFRESVEAYSEKIQVSRPESLESLLATLRRCALASTFGSAYLALSDGKIRDAINLSALARSILKHNCGEVYAAYAELIYLAAKRAQASSDVEILRKVRQGLRKCRKVFRLYVPDTHYVHRAGIQLGIVYHYLALTQESSHLRKRYYQLATDYLEEAIAFAGAKEDGRQHRNERLLAEALTVLSHITSHSVADFALAEEQARNALVAAHGITQYTCEAFLALGSIYYMQAKRSASLEDRESHVKAGRWSVNQALEKNQNASARIKAAGYLRLAELCLLLPGTQPEVRYYFQKWLQVKEAVENDFLHHWGRKVNEEMQTISEHLFIDAGISFKPEYWESKVEEHLMYAAIRELAKQLQGKQSEQLADEQELKDKMRTEIRDYLKDKFKIKNANAYNKINKYKLVDKLREYMY